MIIIPDKQQRKLINRSLTDEDRQYHLSKSQETNIQPADHLSLVKINSTYIEIVDSGYQWTGILTSICLPSLYLLYRIESYFFTHNGTLGLITGIIFLPIVLIAIFLPFLEWFGWTHYPLRINRKNRMVYEFRADGAVMCATWDEIYFTQTANSEGIMDSAQLKGCVMAEDGETVLAKFAFGTQCEDHEGTLEQWEFIKRYMNDGPKNLVKNVKFCVPSGKREGFFTGFERISAHFPKILWIPAIPFSLYLAFWRFLIMRSCKVPVWPKEVEDACVIERDDPFTKDYQSNPANLQ
jgi:hypothetical protein